MKTTKTIHTNADISTELAKGIALKLFLDEDFFIIENGEEVLAFEGELKKAKQKFKAAGNKSDDSFTEWALESLIRVTEIFKDEESDGYMVLTDEEAYEKAAQNIEDSLWAFDPSFLSNMTGIDMSVFEAVQANGKCEDNNDAIRSCIGDVENFVQEAIEADGRGHFISSYDGKEQEQTVSDVLYYIYRLR